MNILLHPYLLVLYGICIWELEQSLFHKLDLKKRIGFIGSGLIWAGGIVAWDDEMTEFVVNQFNVSLELDWYFYLGAGFCIDIIRRKVHKDEHTKQRERGADL